MKPESVTLHRGRRAASIGRGRRCAAWRFLSSLLAHLHSHTFPLLPSPLPLHCAWLPSDAGGLNKGTVAAAGLAIKTIAESDRPISGDCQKPFKKACRPLAKLSASATHQRWDACMDGGGLQKHGQYRQDAAGATCSLRGAETGGVAGCWSISLEAHVEPGRVVETTYECLCYYRSRAPF